MPRLQAGWAKSKTNRYETSPPKIQFFTKQNPMPPKIAKKTKKDPNAPKRALSAYMIFSQENRQKVKDENPKATFGEMGKLLGNKWKEMTDKDKEVYRSSL
jgi:HMG (high mobility group) box